MSDNAGAFDAHGNAIVGNIAIPASHVPAFRALLCGERVAPDRETVAEIIWRSDLDYTPEPDSWSKLTQGLRDEYLLNADALIASGVLGVSAGLIRAEARWKALGEAAEALAAYRDKRRSTLSISHATDALRVVSALHAEASAEHLRLGMEAAEHPAHSGHEYGGAYARAGALAAGDPDWMNATDEAREKYTLGRPHGKTTRFQARAEFDRMLDAVRAEVIDWMTERQRVFYKATPTQLCIAAREHFGIEADRG